MSRFWIIFYLILSINSYAQIGPSFKKSNDWQKTKLWSEVVQLKNEQKFQAALKIVEKNLTKLQGSKDEENWTRALFLRQQLMVGLHQAENSVKVFKESKWPESPTSQIVLNLYYAQTLKYYYYTYSWEINKREKLITQDKLDLKKWTKEDITQEIHQSMAKIWSLREKIKQLPKTELNEFIQTGNYPDSVRGTLRDALTYFFVSYLQDSQFWSAEHSHQTKMLNLQELINPPDQAVEPSVISDSNQHPLVKISAMLNDLEKWHWSQDRISALIEARLEKYRVLKSHFNQADEVQTLIKALQKTLQDYQVDPWWAQGMYLVADFTAGLPHDDAIIEAIEIAQKAAQNHPNTSGAKRCLSLVNNLKSPNLSLQMTSHDVGDKRSILVTHKNWQTVYFKAYKFDPVDYLLKKKENRNLPSAEELKQILSEQKIIKSWNKKLDHQPDFRTHKTFVQIPLTEPGFYVILASGKEDFSTEPNFLNASYVNITGLHVIKERLPGKYLFHVKDAKTGQGVAATIKVYEENWKTGHKFHKEFKTDKAGSISLNSKDLNQSKSYYSVTEKGSDRFYDLNRFYYYNHQKQRTSPVQLILTDRAIYRPGQTIFFKVLSFENRQNLGELPKALPKSKVEVELVDSNWKVVEKLSLTTNEFATAAGSFKIPISGKALGAWTIRSSNGNTPVKIEEYKRPTFTTQLLATKKPARLNQQVEVEGEAKYYYGLPLKDAQVKWTVTRKASYPYWYYWWWGEFINTNPEIIASGSSKTNNQGLYTIKFTPRASEQEVNNEVQFNYAVSVDVLDQGGETSSSDKVFVLGKHAVKTQILQENSYLTNTQEAIFDFILTDLNNKPLQGEAKFKLHKLKEPAQVPVPTEQPLYYLPRIKIKSKYTTKGDELRSRWDPLFEKDSILKSFNNLKQVKKGDLLHKGDGSAKLNLGRLKAGAYRLNYKVKDPFGMEYQTQKEFLVLNKTSKLKLPLVFEVNKQKASVGESIKFFVHSGYQNIHLTFEILQNEKVIFSKILESSKSSKYISFKIKEEHLGGITARISSVVDHNLMKKTINIAVPYVHKKLNIDLSRIRKKVQPGEQVEWTITIKSNNKNDQPVGLKQKAEVLAFMYDKSLDAFTSQNLKKISAHFPQMYYRYQLEDATGIARQIGLLHSLTHYESVHTLDSDSLMIENSIGIGIGGPGMRGGKGMMFGMANDAIQESAAPMVMAKKSAQKAKSEFSRQDDVESVEAESDQSTQEPLVAEQIRKNFSETAFFSPHLLSDKKGNVQVKFTMPDSLTAWNFWTYAMTRDLDFGEEMTTIQSMKDLMVRTYLPRFLRQGDKLNLKILITNAGSKKINGQFFFEIMSDKTDLAKTFKLDKSYTQGISVELNPGDSKDYSIPVTVPNLLGEVIIKAHVKAKNFSDGEEKRLPLLPSRTYLAQSRFISLKSIQDKTIQFQDMTSTDASRINDSLVLKVDSQLFYSILSSLPYLVYYPYQCTEQTLNRFLSAAILGQTYEKYPSVAKMAKKLKKRSTQYEAFDAQDPNRKMSLEETPWLQSAQGGSSEDLINMLDPKRVKELTADSLNKLKDAQTASGGFPWFPGGAPSYYMTTYIIYGLAKAQEFGVQIPKRMTVKAWQYVKGEYEKVVAKCLKEDSCYEMITFLNYVVSSFKDKEYLAGAFPAQEQSKMLAFSFKHWKKLSPQLKALLAMTLKRNERSKDALLVFDSIMDSAQTEEDLGTFWAPEDRAWLWYNDTIETHAFILRALVELKPKDQLRHGLVQWLFLNKKLNHWKSTKATAEVMYSVLHYLNQEDLLEAEQKIKISVGDIKKEFHFKPDEYSGKNNFVVISGSDIDETKMHKIQVSQTTKGMSFASATWHYSTEKLPTQASGDFFEINRSYFIRTVKNNKTQLLPIVEGTKVNIGDEVEVHLSIRAKHAAEYVMIKDPRPAGFEPVSQLSGHKWDLGLIRYQEVRDSGMNFFMESIPVGEYTLTHRIRANMQGEFRANPATIESVYAPEFKAFSAGSILTVNKED